MPNLPACGPQPAAGEMPRFERDGLILSSKTGWTLLTSRHHTAGQSWWIEIAVTSLAAPCGAARPLCSPIKFPPVLPARGTT